MKVGSKVIISNGFAKHKGYIVRETKNFWVVKYINNNTYEAKFSKKTLLRKIGKWEFEHLYLGW